MRSNKIKQYSCWGGVDEERTQNAVRVVPCLFFGDMIDPSLAVKLLVAGSLVPALCSLALVWCIGARGIGLLVGTLPGIVPSLSTSKTGNLSWKVGLDSTLVRWIECCLGVDLLLRLVVLAECLSLVLLLLITRSCWS